MCFKAPLQGTAWGFIAFKQCGFPTLPLFLEYGQVNNAFQIDAVNPAPLVLQHAVSYLAHGLS